MASLRGLEPPTHSLGNCYSIRLSYKDVVHGEPYGFRSHLVGLRDQQPHQLLHGSFDLWCTVRVTISTTLGYQPRPFTSQDTVQSLVRSAGIEPAFAVLQTATLTTVVYFSILGWPMLLTDMQKAFVSFLIASQPRYIYRTIDPIRSR